MKKLSEKTKKIISYLIQYDRRKWAAGKINYSGKYSGMVDWINRGQIGEPPAV